MGHLREPSVEAIRELLATLAPDLLSEPINVLPVLDVQPAWKRAPCFVGGDHVLKICWSHEAEEPLRRQVQLLPILSGFDADLPTPALVAASDDPVALLYRRIHGQPLTYDGAGALKVGERRTLAGQIAAALRVLHGPLLLDVCERAGMRFGPPLAQATASELRRRLASMLDDDRRDWLERTLVWVDVALARSTRPVLLHADFHGYNLVIDDAVQLRGVLDFEGTAIGPAEFDFRYLPRQSPTLEFLDDVVTAYELGTGVALDRDAILAWHVLTDLGDALWRTEAGVEVVAGPIGRRLDDLRSLLAVRGLPRRS